MVMRVWRKKMNYYKKEDTYKRSRIYNITSCLKAKNVIELHMILIKYTDTKQTAQKCIAFEKSLWIL